MIGDSLTEDVMQSMEGACFGLKTPCSHCFHVKCLTHWAAISIVQKENKKSTASWITDRNQNSIKTLHGQLKSSESDVTSLLEQQEKCDIEIAETKKELIRALEYEQDKNAILNDKNSLKKERNKTKSASKTIEKKKKNDEIFMKEIGTPSGPGSGSGSVVNDIR